jgi:hypothetical protein
MLVVIVIVVVVVIVRGHGAYLGRAELAMIQYVRLGAGYNKSRR